MSSEIEYAAFLETEARKTIGTLPYMEPTERERQYLEALDND